MRWRSLFRKYRPKSFSEMVGQNHITSILENSIKSSRISSAYLFCGPRGTGKTSAARIFAKSLNCFKGMSPFPCQECEMCRNIAEGVAMDVIEIDAASNTQVEKVREFIIQRVAFAPTQGKYKVYIIDEVHKLSDSAFNALLKTLEEPPSHTVFILATTHPQKLLPTILSRCQRYDFKRISAMEIAGYLMNVSKDEKINIDREALELIARNSEGSLRDAMVFLEQSANCGSSEIDCERVIKILGVTSAEKIHGLAKRIVSGDTRGALDNLRDFICSGIDPEQLTKDILNYFRGLLLIKAGRGKWVEESWGAELLSQMEMLSREISFAETMLFLKILLELKLQLQDPSIAQILCEIAVVRMLERDEFSDTSASPAPEEISPHTAVQPRSKDLDLPADNYKEFDLKRIWPRVMGCLKNKKMFLHAILLGTVPVCTEGKSLEIGFKKNYAFHIEKVKEYREELEKIIEEFAGRKIGITCRVLDDGEKVREEEISHEKIVSEALELFGGTQL